MIVHKTAIHQNIVKIKLLQVTLWSSIMNQSPYYNGSCKSETNFCGMVFVLNPLTKLTLTMDRGVIVDLPLSHY